MSMRIICLEHLTQGGVLNIAHQQALTEVNIAEAVHMSEDSARQRFCRLDIFKRVLHTLRTEAPDVLEYFEMD